MHRIYLKKQYIYIEKHLFQKSVLLTFQALNRIGWESSSNILEMLQNSSR